MRANSTGEAAPAWRLVYTKQAQKDAKKLAAAGRGLKRAAQQLLAVLETDPWQMPYEKLVGDLAGAYSRRISFQHRLVYQVLADERVVKVLRLWTHYA